jgi:hypothetical protein
MANEIDLSLLTTDDYQDYWNQFLRFYADESGKNFSKKLPISYLDKVLRDEIIEKYELDIPSYSSRNMLTLQNNLFRKVPLNLKHLDLNKSLPKNMQIPCQKLSQE